MVYCHNLNVLSICTSNRNKWLPYFQNIGHLVQYLLHLHPNCQDLECNNLPAPRKDFVILQLYHWLFSSTKHCIWNTVQCVVILQSYFPSYNYQQDKSTYYDCWITLQSALKIAASNLYCKITLVWLDSSLSVQRIYSKFKIQYLNWLIILTEDNMLFA